MDNDEAHGPQPGRTFELSDSERRALAAQLGANLRASEHLGFALRGQDTLSGNPVVAELPGTPAGDLSVCGLKDRLIDELRRFQRADGEGIVVRCAAAAVLEMTDAPVHVHAATLEYYLVLAGSGKMLLGAAGQERVTEVTEGSLVVLPPGQPHGLMSNDPEIPVRALLTFTPGLAPKNHPEFRDEKILFARTSERIRQLETALTSHGDDPYG